MLGLASLFFCALDPAHAITQQISEPPLTMVGKSRDELRQATQNADIIYIGEVHDNAVDHKYECAVVRNLIQSKVPFAIGWEMFDRTQQHLLDQWDSGEINLKALFRQTGFDQSWAVYSPVYGRILKIAQRWSCPNIALNAPQSLVHKIARNQSLTPKEKGMLPSGFSTDKSAYRNFVSLMGGHPGMPSARIRAFFAAQNTWDQTMADRILKFRFTEGNGARKLVVLTGRGHVAGGFGIPLYVRQKARMKQLILLAG
jgi:uncharacterized iron-regulated protein